MVKMSSMYAQTNLPSDHRFNASTKRYPIIKDDYHGVPSTMH